MKKFFPLLLVIILLSGCNIDKKDSLTSEQFKNPPQSSKVHTWWHWVSGNISRDGITKDLESMNQLGISEATILNIGSWYPMDYILPRIEFDSQEWFDMFKWALQEASRLGISIGVHNCDGWSTSGGPWITPEKSMKQFVWTKLDIEGGKEINILLPQPQAWQNFYRDVSVIAFPVKNKLNSYQEAAPDVIVNNTDAASILYDGNPQSEFNIKPGESIKISFTKDFSTEKLVIFPHLAFDWGDMSKINAEFRLSSSKDGFNYKKIKEFELLGVNKMITISIPETNARFFKLDCIKGSNNYAVSEIELLRENENPSYSSELTGLLEKIGSVKALTIDSYNLSTSNNSKGISENSIINLTSSVNSEGWLTWNAPEGEWRVIRFGYTSTGKTNGPATPEGTGLEVDKMDADALDFHFEHFDTELLQTAGEYVGNTFKFLLIDSWECIFQNWTQKFPEEFSMRRGYDLTPWIPVLCGEIVENKKLSEAFLYDFRKTISDLIGENYYKHFSELCHANQLELHAEVIYGNDGPYPPLDILKSNNYPDMPMTEFWSNPNMNQFPDYRPEIRPRNDFPTYAALACSKQIIGSEAYTGYAHYSEAPSDLKPFGDAAFCSGINQMILHSYVHQPFDKKPGLTLMRWGAHFNRNNPWWEFARGWMDYQARIQYILQKGDALVDVIFYIGDQLPEYFNNSIVGDLPYGIQANACNFDMLKNQATVRDGQLSFGGKQRYTLLALPEAQGMEFETLQRVAQLVKEGLIVYGPKPQEMLSVQDLRNNRDKFEKLLDDLWGNSEENDYGKGKVISGKPLEEVLNELHLTPDFNTNVNDPMELMFIHKRLDEADIYFVFNQQKKALNRELLFRVEGKSPEIWDPVSGTHFAPAIYSQEKNLLRIPVSFKPHESKFFIFRNGSQDHSIKEVALNGSQIFPQTEIDSQRALPSAVYDNGRYKFIVPLGGEYTFTSIEGETLNKKLLKQEAIEIKNFKAQLEFFPVSEDKIDPLNITELKSLAEFDDPAIKYFAGKVKYTILFDAPEKIDVLNKSLSLNLGNIDATAEVSLNGELLNYAWLPYADIPVAGLLEKGNKLEIVLATVCRNRIIGDLNEFGEVKSLFTSSPIASILNKEMPLKPSGIIGPMKLEQKSFQTVN